MLILKRQVNLSSDFSSFFRVISHNTTVNFSSYISYFGQKDPMKVPILTLLMLLMLDSAVSWKKTPLYFFRSNVIYIARKGPIKLQIFETFECLDQSSPNSCHFWNNKSVFLQILHHSYLFCTIVAEILYTFNKRSLTKYKLGKISPEQLKVWNFVLWWAPSVKIT